MCVNKGCDVVVLCTNDGMDANCGSGCDAGMCVLWSCQGDLSIASSRHKAPAYHATQHSIMLQCWRLLAECNLEETTDMEMMCRVVLTDAVLFQYFHSRRVSGCPIFSIFLYRLL